MDGHDALNEYLEKARRATPVGGKTPAGYTVKMVGGKREYVKEGPKQMGLFDQPAKQKEPVKETPKAAKKPKGGQFGEEGDTNPSAPGRIATSFEAAARNHAAYQASADEALSALPVGYRIGKWEQIDAGGDRFWTNGKRHLTGHKLLEELGAEGLKGHIPEWYAQRFYTEDKSGKLSQDAAKSKEPVKETPKEPKLSFEWQASTVKASQVQEMFISKNPDAATAARAYIENADNDKIRNMRKNKLRSMGIIRSKGEWHMGNTPKPMKPKEEKKLKVEETKVAKPKSKEKLVISTEKRIEQVGEHVWGSRKDLAALAKEVQSGNRDLSQEDLATMSYDDAAYLINKKNLVPAWDVEALKGFGMTPGGAHLALSVVAAIKAKPEDSAPAREQYRSDVRSILGGLKDCKTADDVERMMREIGQEMRSRDSGWRSVKQMSQVQWGGAYGAAEEAAKMTEATGVKHSVVSSPGKGIYIGVRGPSPYEQFGSKFKAMATNYRSKLWRAAKYEARAADNAKDGWQYLQERGGSTTNKTIADKRKASLKEAGLSGETKRGWSEAKIWQALEGQPIRRKGHAVEVDDADPDRVKSTFGLGEVDYGLEGYMTQADREYHTKQFEGAMHDFAEIIGVEPHTLSLKGRLSIAFGARGRGAAKAHYEPMGKIINITKYRGGGSLSHEWGHAMDNVMAEVFTDKGSKAAGVFLSEGYNKQGVPVEISKAMGDLQKAITKHPNPDKARKDFRAYIAGLWSDYRKESDKAVVLVKEQRALLSRPETQEFVDKAIDRYTSSIHKWEQEADEQDRKNTDRESKRLPVSLEKQMDVLNKRSWVESYKKKIQTLKSEGPRSKKDNDRLDSLKLSIEGYRLATNRMKARIGVIEKTDPEASNFSRGASMLGGYYGSTVEKFARSFESFVQDKLVSKDRLSDYLTGGRKTESTYDTQAELPDGSMAQPYPQGEERKAINKAMDNLMQVLRDSGSLAKAFGALHGESFFIQEPLKKAFIIAPPFRMVRHQGSSVPSLDQRKIMAMLETPAPAFNAMRLLDHDGPRSSVQDIVKGLFADNPTQENIWTKFLTAELNSATNELNLRRGINHKMIEDRLDPALRKALFQRTLSYYRDLKKSVVQVMTPDELKKAQGEGSRGGNVVGHTSSGKPIYEAKNATNPYPSYQPRKQKSWNDGQKWAAKVAAGTPPPDKSVAGAESRLIQNYKSFRPAAVGRLVDSLHPAPPKHRMGDHIQRIAENKSGIVIKGATSVEKMKETQPFWYGVYQKGAAMKASVSPEELSTHAKGEKTRLEDLYMDLSQQAAAPNDMKKGGRGTPIGGVTPGGYKRTSATTYQKMGHDSGQGVGTHWNPYPKPDADTPTQELATLGKYADYHAKNGNKEVALKLKHIQGAVKHGQGPQAKGLFESLPRDVQAGVGNGYVMNAIYKSLSKADPRGGTYHKRVTNKSGKHRYYYDEDKYKSSKDAHVSGPDAQKSYITKTLSKMVETSGKDGCCPKDMKHLVKKYGAKSVGGALKESCGNGGLQFKKGKFYAKTKNEPKT